MADARVEALVKMFRGLRHHLTSTEKGIDHRAMALSLLDAYEAAHALDSDLAALASAGARPETDAEEITRADDPSGVGEWVSVRLVDGRTVRIYTTTPLVWIEPERH